VLNLKASIIQVPFICLNVSSCIRLYNFTPAYRRSPCHELSSNNNSCFHFLMWRQVPFPDALWYKCNLFLCIISTYSSNFIDSHEFPFNLPTLV
jgi:hypothetical protein